MRALLSLALFAATSSCTTDLLEDEAVPTVQEAELSAAACRAWNQGLDRRHGDGVCEPNMACLAPDVDCLEIHANPAAAAKVFGGFERDLARQQLRPTRAVLATNDARVQRLQSILVAAWNSYRAAYPVGKLAQPPALVVVDTPEVNASVLPTADGDKMSYAVHVNVGVLADLSEQQIAAFMLHELGHLMRLHEVANRRRGLQRWYQATAIFEPLGYLQRHDATLAALVTPWMAHAAYVGPSDQLALGGLPFLRHAWTSLRIIAGHLQAGPAACTEALAQLTRARDTYLATQDLLTGAYPAVLSLGAATQAMTQASQACATSTTLSLVDVLAEQFGVSLEEARSMLTPAQRSKFATLPVLAQLAAFVEDKRRAMRAVKAELAARNIAWQHVRYYGAEEEADDLATRALVKAGVAPSKFGQALINVLPPAAQQACNQRLASGTPPPYGEDLVDDHHTSCWRAWHITQRAQQP